MEPSKKYPWGLSNFGPAKQIEDGNQVRQHLVADAEAPAVNILVQEVITATPILSAADLNVKPDLNEARRLLASGMHLIQLKSNSKAPLANEWNSPSSRVKGIDARATGYGLPLALNNMVSVDPDNNDLAVIGMRALGFDLEAIMAAGVRTKSTRTGSGGRSAFSEVPGLTRITFAGKKPVGTVLELRAGGFQDVVPGLVYHTNDGEVCTQQYVNGKRYDDLSGLSDKFLEFWLRCSSDINYLREAQAKFFAALPAVDGVPAHANLSISTGKLGESLAFDAPGIRGPFNNANSVESVLGRHGYTFDEHSGNWSHPAATGKPGIHQIPGREGLWRSHHAGDPLSGTFDAWVAHVVLDHDSNLDQAIAAFNQSRHDSVTGAFDEVVPGNGGCANADRLGPQEIDLDTPDLCLILKATEWVVPGFMSTGLTVIAGRAGGGKTSSLVSMFAQVAHLCAPDAMLKPTLRRHICYMAEDVDQVKRCLYGLWKHGNSGLTEQEFLAWFHIIPSRRVLAKVLANTIKKCNEKYSYTLPNGFVVKPVLIADTANATLELDNENDNSEVGRAVAILKQALDGMALAVVAHTAKSLARADLSEMSPRGATAWIGDANATIYAFEDEKLPKARFLGLGKHRFEPEMREIGFESDVYVEIVEAAWGESQTVKYRVSAPMRSSADVRQQARAVADEAAEVKRFKGQSMAVFDALIGLEAGEYMTKRELRDKVLKGQTKIRDADLDALIADKLIVPIEPGEGGYTKRNNAHKEGFVLSEEVREEMWAGAGDDRV
jgi:hypothetical protein